MNETYEAFAGRVDACESLEQVKHIQEENRAQSLREEFWRQRKIVLTAEDELEKEKAQAKADWIQAWFGCSIPLSGRVSRFSAPHGLYGILIAPRVRLGKGCVIFPNVIIGANTLPDSPNMGLPSLGENVYIGAGARIIGNIAVGSNARIGANCCVTEDVPPNAVVVGPQVRLLPRRDARDNAYLSWEKAAQQRFATRADYAGEDMAARLRLEQAEAEDLDALVQLIRERISFFRWKKMSQWDFYLLHHPKEELLREIERGEFYLIRNETELAAAFRLSGDSVNWEDETPAALYLSRVVTRPCYKNLGGYLAEQAKSLARRSGKDSLRLECVAQNQRLNELWQSHGFRFVRDGQSTYHYALYECPLNGDTGEEDSD